uniref:Uncharacterized protein n=1 Tax=Kalanchoe fedtschenkoi TaxID=63787 RepID=A0A7N0U9B5_KALFE
MEPENEGLFPLDSIMHICIDQAQPVYNHSKQETIDHDRSDSIQSMIVQQQITDQINAADGLLCVTGHLATNNRDQEMTKVASSSFDNEKSTKAQLTKRATRIKSEVSASGVKGRWSHEEDRQLTELVNELGTTQWSSIAKNMKGRVGKQCRERWLNQLMPDIKREAWSAEEDQILIAAHKELGTKWSEITKRLPGRTENAVKNYWNATKRRQEAKRKTMAWKHRNSGLLQNYIKDLSTTERPSPSSSTNSDNFTVSNLLSGQGSLVSEDFSGFGSSGETFFQNCIRSFPPKRSSPPSSFNSYNVGNINFCNNLPSSPNFNPSDGFKANGSSKEIFFDRIFPPTRLSRTSSFNRENVGDIDIPGNTIVYSQPSDQEDVPSGGFVGDGRKMKMLSPTMTSFCPPSSLNITNFDNTYIYNKNAILGLTSEQNKVSFGGFVSDEEIKESFSQNDINSSFPRVKPYKECSTNRNSTNNVNLLCNTASYCLSSIDSNAYSAAFDGDGKKRETFFEDDSKSLSHPKWSFPLCSLDSYSIGDVSFYDKAVTYELPTGQKNDPFEGFTNGGNKMKMQAGDSDGIYDLKTWFEDFESIRELTTLMGGADQDKDMNSLADMTYI